jgi:hypothetical protein
MTKDNNIKNKNKNNIFNIKLEKNKQGSALLMAILILSSIIAVSFSVSRMVMTAIETGGVQAQSVMAYYSSEAGVERVLYGIRQGDLVVEETNPNLFDGTNILNNGSDYTVFVEQYNPLKIISVGSFESTKRSVEVSF